MGIALAVALLTFAGAHVSLVVGLARRHAWTRAVPALFVPPLAPWWGWEQGMRRRAIVWGVAVGLYALGVMAIRLTEP